MTIYRGFRTKYVRALKTLGFACGLLLLLLFPASGWSQWVAYNDHAPGSGTHSNATRYHVFANGTPASGFLRNINQGTNLAVQLIMTRTASGVVANGFAGAPAGGTPVSQVFLGFVDFVGAPDPSIEVAGAGVVTYTFTNLNPARLYKFHGSSVRGTAEYTNRWALCEIVGTTNYSAAHSSNVLTKAKVPALTTAQAALNSGANHTASTGDYVSWDAIQPNSNGTFSVTCRQYTGTVPGGTSNGSKGYALSAIRLEEFSNELVPVAIASQPSGQTLAEGQTAVITADATGNPVLYQWLREGSPVPGATNRVLSIPCISRNDAGAYSFTVSNALGSATSSVVMVKVVVPQLVEWGRNEFGQVNVPLNLSNVVMMAAGSWHGLALQGDGKVIGWGRNDHGETNIPPDVRNPVAIAAGFYYCMALLTNGTVRCWGDNAWGQCNVPAGLSNVVMLAPGYDHALVLKADGTVAAWGRNQYGQITVPAGLSNVVKVVAGGHQSLALKADGTVVGWGAYDGTGPLTIPANLTNVVELAAANLHTMALRRDGKVVAWGGDNATGQLNVPASLSNVIAIAAGNGFGGSHSAALKADGTITLWGFNNFNQSTLLPCLPKVTAIAAGEYYNMLMNEEDATVTGPIISTRPFVVGAVGRPIYHRLALRNGPAVLTASGMPAGVQLDPATGLLSGFPSIAGRFAISLSASNAGGATERTVTMIVLTNPNAPEFSSQPLSQTAFVGDSVKLQVTVNAPAAARFQWYFNGMALAGQTNSKLTLDPVQLTNAGSYQVFAESSGGSLWSDVATLTVVEGLRFQPGGLGFDESSGIFYGTVGGMPGFQTVVVESSTNLVDWTAVFTNNMPAVTWGFTNQVANADPNRFFRLRGNP